MSNFKQLFSYFGNKRNIAPKIWNFFGKVDNYVEPFCGSLSVLFANPNIPKVETVNDIDCMVTNFWRSMANDPDKVAYYAFDIVNEADLHAKQIWILKQITSEFKKKMHEDIEFYDAKIAGIWLFGKSASISNNWMHPKGLTSTPVLSSAGEGINGRTTDFKKLFKEIHERLIKVRVCCGDWTRIVTPYVTFKNKAVTKDGYTAIFLDPPYDLGNRDKVYLNDSNPQLYSDVCKWAIENGENNKLKIIVCGYDGDYQFPNNWIQYNWSANGGFGNKSNKRGKDNAKREVLYISPHCNNNVAL